MKRKIRKLAVVLTLSVFLGSASVVVYQQYQYYLGHQAYTQAEQLSGLTDLNRVEAELPMPDQRGYTQLVEQPVPVAQQPEDTAGQEKEPEPEPEPVWVDPYADALAAMDFAALQQVNEEVLGWILIPGTPVSYPLVQGEDNQKYLNTTWRGSHSSVGSIFLECENSADLSDFHSIIYGHRTQNKSMFGSLRYYAEQDYWSKHPYIYITDASGSRVYTVFAAYEAGVTQQTFRLGFEDESDRQEFIDFAVSSSVIKTDVIPTTGEQILTLSTCTGRGHDTRWVVQAVLR